MNTFPCDTYNNYINEYEEMLLGYANICDTLSSVDNWTIRNHVTHLIDSASNNHQRFIRLQLQNTVKFPGYDAEPWVAAAGIITMEYVDLVRFWKLYNVYLINIINNIDSGHLKSTWTPTACTTAQTLDFLVRDYFEHLKLHADWMKKIAKALEC